VKHPITGPPHHLWSPEHPPALTVSSGAVLEFDLTEATDGQFTKTSTTSAVDDFDWDRVYPLMGPVVIEDAQPGDTLQIEFLDMTSTDWGWTAVLPGLGLLAEQFPDAHLHIWDLATDAAAADFFGLARIPVRPFCGVVGVCPDVGEPAAVLPPGVFGGNLDCRDLTTGSRLYLPVQVPGALLSFGDPHAAQGDGELCVSAIEASMSGAARVTLQKNNPIQGPRFHTPGAVRLGMEVGGYFATMGVAPDLMQAARDAASAMIDHLTKKYRLDPVDAYILCSVVVDLKITEIVDSPNWVVSAYLPESIFY
jgi:acetamidase/formamidase